MTISFLLGAGFSKNAGLPDVKEISDRFLQSPLDDYILHFVSGEWKWKEFASPVDKNNGNNPDKVYVGMLLENLISHYLRQKNTEEVNYEKFFQFLIDLMRGEKENYDSIVLEAQKQCEARFKWSQKDFLTIADETVLSCFFHLIDDLLYVRKNFEQLEESYKPYMHLIRENKNEINIFTLNHDLLLEGMFNRYNLPYSDGFSKNGGILFDDNLNPISCFDGSFNQRIKLLKLHGSIDIYQYLYVKDENKHKDYDYFKTLNFRIKQTANDINELGEIVQNFTPFITPQIITGDDKLKIIQQDKMYSVLYSRFNKELPGTDLLIIVGFSFNDKHIIDVLESNMDSIGRIVHINPDPSFPFTHGNYTHLNPLTSQIIFE